MPNINRSAALLNPVGARLFGEDSGGNAGLFGIPNINQEGNYRIFSEDFSDPEGSGWTLSGSGIGKNISIPYNSGSTSPAIGSTIIGSTTGSSAKVLRISLSSGTFAGGDAAGTIWLSDIVGSFTPENVNISGGDANALTVSGVITERDELIISDIDASTRTATLAINHTSNSACLPFDRKFVIDCTLQIEVDGDGTDDQNVQMNINGWFALTIRADNRVQLYSLVVDGGAPATHYVDPNPTNLDVSSSGVRVVCIVDPVGKSVKFLLCYRDSVTAANAYFYEVDDAPAKAWSWTSTEPLNIQFSSGSTAQGLAIIRNLEIYVPWMVAMGDSIATGSPGYSPVPDFKSPNYIRSSIWYWLDQIVGGDKPILNAGLGGKQLCGNAGSGDSVEERYASFLAMAPEWFAIYAVTNDIANGRTFAQIQAALTTVVDTILAAGTKVLVFQVAPVNTYDAAKNIVKNAYNAWLPIFASSRTNCFVVEHHDAFEGTTDTMFAPYSADGTHPSIAGYRRLANMAWRKIAGIDKN